jgi:hypothetical protein
VCRLFSATLVFFLLFSLDHPALSQLDRAREPRAGSARLEVPDDQTWRAVSQAAREQALEFLSGQVQSNYEKIATWTGNYSVHQEEYMPADFMRRVQSGGQVNSTQALIAEREATFRFAIDIKSDSIFRDYATARFQMLTADAARKPIVVPNFAPNDTRSVVTRDDYIYFDYNAEPATLSVADTHPEARNRRSAHRVPVEETRKQSKGDLMDPRLFYHCAMNNTSWGELEFYLSVLRGQRGPQEKDLLDKVLTIEEAAGEGGAWYRIRTRMPGGVVALITTTVWCPLAAFNPISLAAVEEKAVDPSIGRFVTWQWRSVDGVFVPAFVKEVVREKDRGGANSYLRIAELKECSLNSSIPPSAFTVKGLNLAVGDLLADEIEGAVFQVDSGGQIKKLANFNERYVPPLDLGHVGTKWVFVVGNIAILAIAVALLALRRSKRRAA